MNRPTLSDRCHAGRWSFLKEQETRRKGKKGDISPINPHPRPLSFFFKDAKTMFRLCRRPFNWWNLSKEHSKLKSCSFKMFSEMAFLFIFGSWVIITTAGVLIQQNK
jgi:predicted permease